MDLCFPPHCRKFCRSGSSFGGGALAAAYQSTETHRVTEKYILPLALTEHHRRFVKPACIFPSYGEVLSLPLLCVGAKASSLSRVVLGGRQARGQPVLDSAQRVREQPHFLIHGLDACEGGKGEQCRDGSVLLTVIFLIRWPAEPSSRTANSD